VVADIGSDFHDTPGRLRLTTERGVAEELAPGHLTIGQMAVALLLRCRPLGPTCGFEILFVGIHHASSVVGPA